jgi:hypothetical protein
MTYPDDLIDAVAHQHGHLGGPCSICRVQAVDTLDAIVAAGYLIVPNLPQPDVSAYHQRMQTLRSELEDELGIELPDGPTSSELFSAYIKARSDAAARHAAPIGKAWEHALRLVNELQEAPDTEADPTPPHGIPRPQSDEQR